MESLLQQNKISSESMSIDEARAVMWLGNDPRYHRPLGELFDEGYLNSERLKWASEKAYEPKLKQAAKVLLNSLKRNSSKSPSTVKSTRRCQQSFRPF